MSTLDKENNAMEAVTLAYDLYEPKYLLEEANPIVLIHGLFWNKFMMQELGKALCEETQRKVYAIDLRNHDESPFCEKCDMSLMIEDVKKFLLDHNINKVVFVCHSFSCSIANTIALEQPETVEKIVMIDHEPWAECSEKTCQDIVLPQFNSQNRFLMTLNPKLSLAAAKRKILSLSLSCTTKSQQLFLRKVAYELDKKEQAFTWKTNIQFLMDRYADKAFVAMPKRYCEHEILLVSCPNSIRLSDETFTEILKYNPNTKFEIIEDTTHLLMLEKTDTFVGIVKKFLNS